MKEGKKSLVHQHKTGKNTFQRVYLHFILFYLFWTKNTIIHEKEIILMRTRFTEEVDTYEKFQEVCRNCSKNYLGYFILLAWGDNTPSDYLEIACDIF